MKNLLDSLRLPDDIKKLGPEELTRLAGEIRTLLINTVLVNGGHLASNLGVVELTLALYKVFDFPTDKIIWDVGHQAYVHKILSGRKDRFGDLRRAGGLSGFPKREESPYDAFNTGHSSTSISAALGVARARDILGGGYRVMTVTGDGALTGGLCYEALNDAGRSANDLIVILNDNNMSISKNVGGMSKYLNRIRSLPAYFSLREGIHTTLDRAPLFGKPLASFISKSKNILKYALIPGTLFEELGFKYYGPVDGHNVGELVKIFTGVSEMRGPVLVHVLTNKGMGYPHAETDPQKFHGVSPTVQEPQKFNGASPTAQVLHKPHGVSPTAQEPHKPHGVSPTAQEPQKFQTRVPDPTPATEVNMSRVFGSELTKLAAKDSQIVAISAAMTSGVGLEDFARDYPGRFFDVGIAEQHALTLAAGMSLYGLKPVAAIYSTFLQRAYDQLMHDICLQNAHVVIAVDRAGVVGEDGETHQGVYDMAFLRHMPNMTVMAPADGREMAEMLRFALYDISGPVAIRYPKSLRARAPAERADGRPLSQPGPGQTFQGLEYGKGELIATGDDVTIAAIGATLGAAAEAAKILASRGIGADLISARFVKPLDAELIRGSATKTGRLLVAEDGCVAGGFGGAVAESLAGLHYKVRYIGLPDAPIGQGERGAVLRKYGLDAEGIANCAMKLFE